ncbi:hypothetical protein CTI12_AA614290 [Artemisia annua]|uniref:Uncharacterized protein n=1 Tax=Artemisia annua TaxID=35608 RepID=A0A2U1KDV2_ARTAN|nr:hypothetical protein CTI12_AA614290 [Artemisia annua]
MAPKYPKLLQVRQQIGDRRVERVLEAVFGREKHAYRCDEKDYNDRIEEVKSRIEHRHGIIRELKKFGVHPFLDDYVEELKAAERFDLNEIGWLIQSSYTAALRVGENSKIIKKVRKLN